MIVAEITKRSIEFEKIRTGTVFKRGVNTYIKGDNKYAVNMETGAVTEVDPLDQSWNECYIYPHASLKLN